MRLLNLHLPRFKNLREVSVEFAAGSPYTVLVGGNGTGKSNLIEAIAWIFRNLDLWKPAPFDYTLTYRCRKNDIFVDAKKNRTPKLKIKRDGEAIFSKLTKDDFLSTDNEQRPLYRPAFVFGYYSGPSDRLAEVFETHREQFRKAIINTPADGERHIVSSNVLRRLFYTQTVHGQFALLAFFMNPGPEADEDREFLRKHLNIDSLDSVLFALKEPGWPWTKRKDGDPRFWNAKGEVAGLFRSLLESAVAPLRMKRKVNVGLAKNPTLENLYIYLPNQESLAKVYERYQNQYAFFTALESIDISTFLGEVITRVKVTDEAGGGQVAHRDMSEGEQQLLLVLGLLKFTAEDEALFLLDEPDTHLNPAWSVQYLNFLNRFIKDRVDCHIVMATHDPLLFSSLERQQVRVVRRDTDGKIIFEEPEDNPQGMGIEAILTSDLFGLRTTLDYPTQKKLDIKRRLSLKSEPLTDDEKVRLAKINSELRPLSYSKTTIDPLFELFTEAWTALEDTKWLEGPHLTEEQRQERAVLASEIVARLQMEMNSRL